MFSVKRSESGFTLLNTLTAILIASVVMAACFGSYVTLQRGFGFITTWSDLNNRMTLVMDCVETDLRNATSITIASSSTAVQTLTISEPQAYTTFYTSTVRGGEPSVAIASSTLNTSNMTGAYGSNSLTVVYSGTTPSTSDTSNYDPSNPNKQIIVRTGTWTNTGGTSVSSGRTIATFVNHSTALTYDIGTTSSNGILSFTSAASMFTSGTVALSGSATAVRINLSGTTNDARRPVSATLQSIVYLRAHNLQ